MPVQTFEQGIADPWVWCSGAVNAVVAYNMLTFPGRILMLFMVVPCPAIVPGLVFLAKDVAGIFAGV